MKIYKLTDKMLSQYKKLSLIYILKLFLTLINLSLNILISYILIKHVCSTENNLVGVSCKFLRNFWKNRFYKTPPGDCFCTVHPIQKQGFTSVLWKCCPKQILSKVVGLLILERVTGNITIFFRQSFSRITLNNCFFFLSLLNSFSINT